MKTLDQLDWEVPRGVERPQLAQLTTCEYLERSEDVVIAGPIGTGKTHLAIALGVEATGRRHRVAFARAADSSASWSRRGTSTRSARSPGATSE